MLDSARTAERGLAMMFGRIRVRLADPDVDLTYRPDETWNRYGALVKHVCYMTQGYLGHYMVDLGAEVRSGDTHWSGEGIDRASLDRLVDDTAALCQRALETMTVTTWQEEIELYGRTMQRGDLPLFALAHGSQHVGQMLLMDRLRKAAAVR
jgi:uncharacterized damage-inducible protein DinB